MEDTLVWRLAGSACLAGFLAAAFLFAADHLQLKGWRLTARNRYDPRNPGAPDPLTGVWSWPKPPKIPSSPAGRHPLIRKTLAFLLVATGLFYIRWRWAESIDWDHWPIALPLILAETVMYADICLFVITLWRLRDRGEPPSPPEGATVDVFICTYNEPVEIVRGTVRGAKAIRYPHKTYLLDDGSRPGMESMAREEGVGYITRSVDWTGKPRHAKAGNIANALAETNGEFILFQDADQIPYPAMLDRTLGYFRDSRVAFVQTPQWNYNAPPDDPLGSQAFIFFGPILQGREGFNATFFCGSNGVMRREALMQAALADYSRETARRVRRGLRIAEKILRAAETQLAKGHALAPALRELQLAALDGRQSLRAGAPLQEVSFGFQRRVHAVSRRLIWEHLLEIEEELGDIPAMDEGLLEDLAASVTQEELVNRLSVRSWSPLAAIQAVHELMVLVDLDRGDEAQPLLPFATVSVTEDIATAARIHAMGWTSIYHHEILARGLAPEDLKSALSQRLRWSQGAFQFHFRESPMGKKGLSIAQKLLYLHSAFCYVSGLGPIAFMAAPIAFILFGWSSIREYDSGALWLHLVPYFVVSQVFCRFWTRGLPAWRGEQYSFSLFPVWVQAIWSAVVETALGKRLSFVVTPKTRQEGTYWGRVKWQLAFLAALTITALVGFARVAAGTDPQPFPTLANSLWAVWNVALLSVVIEGVLYRPDLYRPVAVPATVEPAPAFEAAQRPGPEYMTAPAWEDIAVSGGDGHRTSERELVGAGVGASRTESPDQSGWRNVMSTTPVTKLRNALGGREWEPALVEVDARPNGGIHGDVNEIDSELPREVSLAYDEALRAAKEEIWNASVLMGRRALAEAMKNIEAEGNSLQQQIANAVEKGLLVRTLQEWALGERMSENLRSDGTAEQKWMEAADAREILELCDWTFKYLYLLPAQIEERRKQLVGA